jgi:hypothetical protein
MKVSRHGKRSFSVQSNQTGNASRAWLISFGGPDFSIERGAACGCAATVSCRAKLRAEHSERARLKLQSAQSTHH